MRGRKALAVHLFFVLSSFLILSAADSREDVIRGFDSYKRALLEKNGMKAYESIDKYSRDYYDKLLKMVTGAKKDLLKDMKPVDKLLVLSARIKLTASDIKGMSGKDFFIKCVENGWINPRGITSVALANFNIQEKRAFAWATVGGEIVGTFLFSKEDADWKFDVTSALEGANAGLKSQIMQSDISDDEYIMSVLKSNYGDEASEAVWEPLK